MMQGVKLSKFRVAFMNTATIPHGNSGIFEYRIYTFDQIIDIINFVVAVKKIQIDSYIGYEITQKFIKEKFRVYLPINRSSIPDLTEYDFAIVIRLKYRIKMPSAKKEVIPKENEWEFGILRQISK